MHFTISCMLCSNLQLRSLLDPLFWIPEIIRLLPDAIRNLPSQLARPP